jgi:hypothetical protein
MNLTPDQVRAILGIPAGEPVANATAFMQRWQRMVIGREYGELTIHVNAGRGIRWTERVEHKKEG